MEVRAVVEVGDLVDAEGPDGLAELQETTGAPGCDGQNGPLRDVPGVVVGMATELERDRPVGEGRYDDVLGVAVGAWAARYSFESLMVCTSWLRAVRCGPDRGASSPPGFRRSLSRGDSSGCACRALSSRLDPIRTGTGSQDLCARHWRQCRPKRSRERAPGTRLPKRGPAAKRAERAVILADDGVLARQAALVGSTLSPRSWGNGPSCRAADRRMVRKMAISQRTGNHRPSGGDRLR